MKELKEFLNRLNNNPIIVTFTIIITFADFFVLLIGNNVIQIIAAVIFVAVVAILLQRFFAYKKLKIKTFDKLCEAINTYNVGYKECFEQINDGTITKVTHLNAALTKLTDCIEKITDSVLDCPVCICIKLVDPEKLTDADYKKWQLITIARSSSTKSIRKQRDATPDIVEDNTDFCSILDKNASLNNDFDGVNGFISYDLDKTKEEMKRCGGKYRNSHEDFEYKSTIVYPIQFESQLLPKQIIRSLFGNTSPNNTFITGFLCLDTEKKFENEDESFEKAALLLWHFCQNLSPLFWNYSIMRMMQAESEVCSSV